MITNRIYRSGSLLAGYSTEYDGKDVGIKDYLKLIAEVDRERFAVHLDIINMTNSADRYFAAEEFVDECAELLGSRIRSCHIKDIHLKEEYTIQLNVHRVRVNTLSDITYRKCMRSIRTCR